MTYQSSNQQTVQEEIMIQLSKSGIASRTSLVQIFLSQICLFSILERKQILQLENSSPILFYKSFRLLRKMKEPTLNNVKKKGFLQPKQRGVRFGRPPKKYTSTFISVVQNYYNKKISLSDALSQAKLKRCNFYYHAHRLMSLGYLNIQPK